MAKYRLTLPVRLTYDRPPDASHLAGLLERFKAVVLDEYGPPLPGEGSARFDGYDGPFVTHVGLGEL